MDRAGHADPAAARRVVISFSAPGRNYVRVGAVNATGNGAPSNEVVIDVPDASTGAGGRR